MKEPCVLIAGYSETGTHYPAPSKHTKPKKSILLLWSGYALECARPYIHLYK